MKKIIIVFFLVLSSCSKNNFLNTELIMMTDKQSYLINDKFELKIFVYPLEGEKSIKFYKNFSNLKLSFFSKEEKTSNEEKLITNFIEGPSEDDIKYFNEYKITEEKPFIKVLKGIISQPESKIVFEIPELSISDSIMKSSIKENSSITIKGFCESVYGATENRYTLNEIEILIK